MELNPEQEKAVKYIDSPLLVIAGAGSGKTRVITTKIMKLIKHGINPGRILAVTFTRKAAEEMKNRIRMHLGVSPPYVLTFHSFSLRFLKEEMKNTHYGYKEDFSIYDEEDTTNIIRLITKRLNYDKMPPEDIRSIISITKQKYVNGANPETHLNDYLANIYKKYQKELKKTNMLDYDDLLYYTVKTLLEYPSVREKWNNRFDYVLIDEYQDTNEIQYQLTELITEKHKKITVVGDPQQSIYSFRGACVGNIEKFIQNFSPEIIKLEQNYRSTQEILNVANTISTRISKYKMVPVLWTDNQERGRLLISSFKYGEEEDFIAREIINLKNMGVEFKDIAILIRTTFLSREIEDALLSHNIPYKLIRGFEFYKYTEVKDMIAYMRFFINDCDTASFMRIINTPGRGIGKKRLSIIEKYHQKGWIEALKNALPELGKTRTKVEQFIELYEKYSPSADLMPYTTLMGTIKDTKYLEYVKKQYKNYKERIKNISLLVNILTKVEKTQNTFTSFYENLILAPEEDTPVDKVSIMTIHAAKGLEFTTVFLPYTIEGVLPHIRSFDNQDELEEEQRLFYVGVTRAKKYLYITNSEKRLEFGRLVPAKPSRFVETVLREIQLKSLKLL